MPSSIGSAASSLAVNSYRFEKSAERVAKPGGQPDYVKETVEQTTDAQAITADTKVVKANDEMLGTLLDIKI